MYYFLLSQKRTELSGRSNIMLSWYLSKNNTSAIWWTNYEVRL